jgi:hypothetical protein
MQKATVTILVDESISTEEITQLEKVSNVEKLKSREQMQARISGADSVAGVSRQNGEITVLLEGNEGVAFTRSIQGMISNALTAPFIDYESEQVEGNDGVAYRFSLISIFLLALFIGGATIGLICVSEREGGVMRAIAISPLSLSQYVCMKLVPALCIGIVGVISIALVIGSPDMIPEMITLTLSSVLVCGIAALSLPAFAGNQLAAIGVLKLSMPVMLALPLSAMFVSERLQFLYYSFPVYWQYRAIEAILWGGEPWAFLLLTLLVSAPWFFATLWFFSQKTKLKASRTVRFSTFRKEGNR